MVHRRSVCPALAWGIVISRLASSLVEVTKVTVTRYLEGADIEMEVGNEACTCRFQPAN